MTKICSLSFQVPISSKMEEIKSSGFTQVIYESFKPTALEHD